MLKTLQLGSLLSLSCLLVAHAQSPAQQTLSSPLPAPIVRSYPTPGLPAGAQLLESQPSAGVFVRSDTSHGVEIVTATEAATELRVVHGRADITVHHPANHSQILVDLPGGQVSLFKDGLYTFNAATNTVRVLQGEAEADLDAKDTSRGVKIKETQQLSFYQQTKLKAVNAYRYELTADLLPGADRSHGEAPRGERNRYEGYYPDYAWGYGFYPYSYGFYPYGYGYPFGFGYYGGFRGGFRGYRGGFRR